MGLPSGPQIPSPTLADLGKGRFPRMRRSAFLERYDGDGWHPVARFGSVRDANVALDDAVAAGGRAATLRVTESGPSLARRAGLVAACVAFALVLALIIYMQFFAS